MQQVDETEQHRALRSHQRIVDERVQQHESQPTTDQHALSARRPKQSVSALLERPLEVLDDCLRLGSQRRRGRSLVRLESATAATVAADAEPAPVDEERQRNHESEEQLGEPDQTVLEQAGADEQCRAERGDAGSRVDGDEVLPRLVAFDCALDEQHAAVIDWNAVEQCERRSREFLVSKQQRQNETCRQLDREAVLLLLLLRACIPARTVDKFILLQFILITVTIAR